jgi:hypothetical protein
MQTLNAEQMESVVGGRIGGPPRISRPDPGLWVPLPPGTPLPVDRDPGVPPQ